MQIYVGRGSYPTVRWRARGDGDDEKGKQLKEWRRVGVWCVFGGFELMWMFVVSALLRYDCLLGQTWRLATSRQHVGPQVQ